MQTNGNEIEARRLLSGLFPDMLPETAAALVRRVEAPAVKHHHAAVAVETREVLIVLEGAIDRIFRGAAAGSFVTEVLGPGDCLDAAADAAIGIHVHEAVKQTMFLRVDRAEFHARLRNDPLFFQAVHARLAARHARALRRLSEAATCGNEERLWAEILRLADASDRPYVHVPVSRTARLLGCGRETVSRLLNRFIREGRLTRWPDRISRYVIPAP